MADLAEPVLAESDPMQDDNPRLRYKEGSIDDQGRLIAKIFSHYKAYTIYEADGILQIAGSVEQLDSCPELNALVAKAIALAHGSRPRKRRLFYRLSNAMDQCIAGHGDKSIQMLQDIIYGLSRRATSVARLYYLWSAIGATCVVWGITLLVGTVSPLSNEPALWSLVMVLGGSGALFSVMLNQNKIEVDLDDQVFVHWTAGASRIAIGMIAGAICYLAIKAKMALTLVDQNAPYGINFFCFLSGFSETLVPNLLKSQEDERVSSSKVR